MPPKKRRADEGEAEPTEPAVDEDEPTSSGGKKRRSARQQIPSPAPTSTTPSVDTAESDRAQLEDKDAALRAATARLKEVEEQCAAQVQELGVRQRTEQRLSASVVILRQQVDERDTLLARLRTQNEAMLASDIKQMECRVKEKEAQIGLLQTRLDVAVARTTLDVEMAFQARMLERGRALAAAEDRVRELNAANHSLREQLAKKTGTTPPRTPELEQLRDANAELESTLADRNAIIDQLQDTIRGLRAHPSADDGAADKLQRMEEGRLALQSQLDTADLKLRDANMTAHRHYQWFLDERTYAHRLGSVLKEVEGVVDEHRSGELAWWLWWKHLPENRSRAAGAGAAASGASASASGSSGSGPAPSTATGSAPPAPAVTTATAAPASPRRTSRPERPERRETSRPLSPHSYGARPSATPRRPDSPYSPARH